jgi:transcriptional regulator with XRE-family HTH domain
LLEVRMTDSFGARLRHERERRQIALRSIADSTKINLPLLEGLENDNVARWPSGIFRKAFIRSYAQAIGLDPDQVGREFEERYPDPLQGAAIPPEVPAASAVPSRASVIVRLTINSAGSAFTKGTLLADVRKRWAAAACDAGVSCLIALGLFPVVGHFWTPLGVSMLCYYFGGILILGNTPGVFLFAPGAEAGARDTGPARNSRDLSG